MKIGQLNVKRSAASDMLFLSLFVSFWMFMSAAAYAAGTDSYSEKNNQPDMNPHMAKAQIALARKDYEGALTALDARLAEDSQDADAWNLRGFSLRHLGQYETSKAAYSRALTIKPNHTGALEYMGELYLKLDKPEEAKALLQRLNALCTFNCKDRDALKKAIAAYEAK